MGYVLLWIESLTVSLLLVATLVACLGRLRRRWVQVILLVLVVLLPLAGYAGLSTLAGFMKFKGGFQSTGFYQLLMLTVLFLVGTVWVLGRGLRRMGQEGPLRVAAAWPRRRLAVCLCVAVALHLMTFWNLDLAARQWLMTRQAEAGALALSVAPPRMPDRQNAALIYQQAFDAMGATDSFYDDWDEKWTEWLDAETTDFDPNAPKLREFLEQRSSVLALLRQAAERPGCSFDRDWSRINVFVLLPEESHLRSAARLMALETRCKAADGDLPAALEGIQTLFVMAEHTSSEPLLIRLFSAMAIDSMAASALEVVLASGKPSAEELAVLNVDPGLSYSRCLERALRMEEEAFVLTLFGQTEGTIGMIERAGVLGGARVHMVVFMFKEDTAEFRRTASECRQLATQPYEQAKKQWENLEKGLKQGSRGFLSRTCLSTVGVSIEAATRGDAQRRVVRVALAMHRYRAAGGRFPDKLEDLAPEFIIAVPLDPFDGKPLRLSRTDGGLVVYSIGPDMADNGGSVRYDRKEKTGDIAFELSAP